VQGLKAIVAVTSDKCYENREWVWPYRESDPMGGYDPYSSSKGAAELVISAYRRSYFSGADAPLVASVRAGNVIGGGDWAPDRLIPDIVRSLLADEAPFIRSPDSVRPWQHVLEALGGYLLIAQALMDGHTPIATGWNFGPAAEDTRPVRWIADRLTERWGKPGWRTGTEAQPHEARLLSLDCAKARAELGWRPTLNLGNTLDLIVSWHKDVAGGADAAAVSAAQLADYRTRMRANLANLESRSLFDAC
jgi:CDP-glucose 4,6-dehydratase